MNRHQVLTGACNIGEKCHAVGSVEGIHFTVYAAGCDIVILASDLQRVQIIPGVTHGNVKVSCIDASTDSGKIVASYLQKVYIFEPAPLLHHDSTHKLDYHWYQTAVFEADCVVQCLAWNLEGSKLLTGGEVIQLWSVSQDVHEDVHQKKSVKFSLGHGELGHGHGQDETVQPEHEVETVWENIWKCKPATRVHHLEFSPDGLLFASVGTHDRMVKIWYEDRKIQLPLSHADSVVSPKSEKLNFSFVYIAHPRAVNGLSWRKTSKYMPRGSVANMLITSCKDNVCRIWSETILPDDGLVDLEQFEPNSSFDPKFHMQRHKKRFMQRLKTIRIHMHQYESNEVCDNQRAPYKDRLMNCPVYRQKFIRHAIHKRKKHTKFGPEIVMSMPSLSSVNSAHDFHKFHIYQNGVVPAVHFHLAASINPETDIPLLPVVSHKGVEHNFQLHWLNNKELQFTMESEKILQEMHKHGVYDDHDHHDHDHHGHGESHTDSDSDAYHEEPDENGVWQKKRRTMFKNSKTTGLGKDLPGLGYHTGTSSSIGSDMSDPLSSPESHSSLLDSIDRKIEGLLKDWHTNADMLFSIHPVDGSFLVWHIDWLDEYTPFSFRQAQISFSSRLPRAFPIPDARTMECVPLMYCNYSKMDIKSAMKMSEGDKADYKVKQSSAATGKSSPGQNDNMLIPNVLMISKHSNGSLNQWQISFAEESKFKTVVSVAHVSRACGHRFRTNTATCHPALPLLITTSQHIVPKSEADNSSFDIGEDENDIGKTGFTYCSELILWRVDPVGPLSKSGGIVELAKINSTKRSAFSDVAWVPTLLPSTILGAYSNSPSTLFVASDGDCLKLYQAVIDARSLLTEVNCRKENMSFCSTTSSGYSYEVQDPPSELFNVVSVQSSARPGCIIELDAFTDTQQIWQSTQLLHVFQEPLVTGKSSVRGESNIDPIVDLRNIGSFEENFFLVGLEKLQEGGSTLHMWKITISSAQIGSAISDNIGDKTYMMDYTIVSEDGSNPPSRSGSPEIPNTKSTSAKLLVSTTKVTCQKLPLPDGVEVKCANVSAGHLSSASIYPACLAPYLLVTACSDGSIKFWKCNTNSVMSGLVNLSGVGSASVLSMKSFEFGVEEEDGIRKQRRKSCVMNVNQDTAYSWAPWNLMYRDDKSSDIHIQGKPLTISCAYTGRVAVAYRSSGHKHSGTAPNSRFFNLCVVIYECESTGGSQWVKEDTIELRNIRIPENHVEVDLDLSPDVSLVHNDTESVNQTLPLASSFINMCRTKSVPSLSALYCARKEQEDHEDKLEILRQKHLVQLDWVSTEDGSHILTVGVGSKIMMYAQVSNDIVQESKKDNMEDKTGTETTSMNEPGVKKSLGDRSSSRRALLQKSKSMVVDDYQEVLQWMKLRSIDLTTADGLPPLPMHISWVRGGILVVGMDNEMHVYSQWRWAQGAEDTSLDQVDSFDVRNFEDRNFSTVDLHKEAMIQNKKSLPSIRSSLSVPNFKRFASNVFKKESMKSSSNLRKKASKSNLERSESSMSLTVIHEFGLFEAAHQANPVLPQYHPKSLMELLNFGKVRRVKAILAHLVRCIAGREATNTAQVNEINVDEAKLYRQRTVSMSQSPGEPPVLNGEVTLDYVELTSIPLLPLYALLAADNDSSQSAADISAHTGHVSPGDKSDYKDLFQTNVFDDEELDTNVLSSSLDDKPRLIRSTSSTGVTVNPYHFSSSQAQLLGKHLTHMHLPGLSGQDQMYLLALADTVAQTKTDFAESFEPTSTLQQDGVHTAETLDDCGLRFLLAMRHYHYLMRSLPPVQRVQLHKQGLKTFNLVWAFHSEATEELLSLIPTSQGLGLTWFDLKTYGAGWWIQNINVLKRTTEKLAKDAFQKNKDPMDAALFYLAMKKKNVLWGLFRSIDNKRMSEFFRNDFTQDRWRKAALKNAFDLLGKQRFEHAAGFFLLGGSLNDAVEVILDKLHDLQLAIVVCRLYDGEDMMSETVKKILCTNILGKEDVSQTNHVKMHPDPFLRSMTYWLFKDYRNALQTLLQNESGKALNGSTDSESFSISNVFNFYNYLRTHPLLIRHKIATAAPVLKNKCVISGFTKQQTMVGSPEDDVATVVDRVTPMERRLFFATAHSHYKNGNPILALEVLSKLPVIILSDDDYELDTQVSKSESDLCINTGNLSDVSDSSLKNDGDREKVKNEDTPDWSKPVSAAQTADTFDWSQPTSSKLDATANALDWSQPVSRFGDDDELKLDFGLSDSEESESDDGNDKLNDNKQDTDTIPSIVVGDINENAETPSTLKGPIERKSRQQEMDIFAQQYKFIACLKVMMEEMQTLATGFEVDGGQLRYQVYIWLEREVEALRLLCNYGSEDDFTEDERTIISEGCFESDDLRNESPQPFVRKGSTRSETSLSKPTLHEVLIAEKMDLDAKMERMGQRKQWLRQNSQLLRTLVAYCVLQGAAGGGIASVQMELLLLLQELQQEKPQQQLLSPLPFPTTLPLLSAAIASSKTVTADPIQHIQCLSQDLLHSVIEFTSPPGLGSPLHTVLVMRNLSVALASCVYQCLCDSDSFVVSLNENMDVGFEGFYNGANFVCDASHLMSGVRKMRYKSITSADDVVNTPPPKWPGVTSLRVLLAREKDEDSPKLNILLTECLVAVYVSLVINALATYDCFLLYRLTAHKFDTQMWSSLFGGGVKTMIKLGSTSPRLGKKTDDLYNKRIALNRKIMGQQRTDSRKTFKEKFVPPELSMITYFMTKPFVDVNSETEFGYNSDDSMSSEDGVDSDEDYEEELNRPRTLNLPNVQQHSDPSSYAWCIIRYTAVKLILHNLSSFLPQIGIELQELPVCSPLLHALLRTLEQWQEVLLGKLELFAAAPDNFIPGLELEVIPGVPKTKYKALLNKKNSPFIESPATLPIKRLWFHLLREDKLRDIFVRYVFKKQKLLDQSEREDSSIDGLDSPKIPEPFKIIHKEQDIITAFAINQANASCLTLSTQKELIELDIHNLLNPPLWLDDENEMDIEAFNNPSPVNPAENVDFLVVQTPTDAPIHAGSGSNTPQTNQSSTASTPIVHLAPGQIALAQTGRGTSVVSRRAIPGVRRISSHPSLPHYLTGSSDGSVRLWEWGHSQPLAMLRSPGNFPKVTKVLFNSHGNKCSVSDSEGNMCLWQVGPGINFNKPIMSFQCHNKTTSDFVFVGSSSLIATAGNSSESRNVCLWDTLLPPRSACVHAFTCHEHGSPALVYAPHHQLLISGGRKGEICIFDIRQRQMRHTFQAHESIIRCLAMDPEEEYFVTGSADGDVKVWGLDVHQLIVAFQGEHTRSNTFFRSVGSATGVTQVAIGPKHHLFSCGVDGSMKFRALPERESIVRYWNS
ncbi:dmX-like protein 2 isoform X5 [Ruditapes philippinarum]|uniref:dmX-like protein 2 isoform X5 n=1 Tax=Ruditapes philippinarum TaxID=129788 RepID=UPI00295ACE7F|nr:dmX-like protein 2 isoform X5 [Ruditapes philippinarum]